MKRYSVILGILMLLVLPFAGFSGASAASTKAGTTDGSNTARACGAVPAGYARCFAIMRTDVAGINQAFIAGYGPTDLRSAYHPLSLLFGPTMTVAIVDAYNDPNAESDLAVYRTVWSPCLHNG